MDRQEPLPNWDQVKGRARNRWSRLTEEHIEQIGGDRERLSQRLQALYGIAERDAREQVMAWEQQINRQEAA